MRKKLRNKLLLIIPITIIFIWSFIGSKGEMVENLSTPIAVGDDIVKGGAGELYYSVPISVYVFDASGNVSSRTVKANALSIGETREIRQLRNNKKYLLGLEKVFILSEDFAKFGITNILDIIIHNPQVNDRAEVVVCKGKVEDIMNYKMDGGENTGEFIEEMVKNLDNYNFFTAQYTMMDLIVRTGAEGRNASLPYMEITENGPEITGLALFRENKMVGKVDVKESKIINLLKQNKVKGMLTVQKNTENYTNFYTESKRKVKCYKEGEKYKFVINLNLNGMIVSNELYKDINYNPEELKKFVSDMENLVEKKCQCFVNKCKSEYKTDVLELGRIAAAKYGRHSGTDWNKVISESDIKVNVKVKVHKEGRGEY